MEEKIDMNQESVELFPKFISVVSELEKTKQENECLKKALGELVVERQILKSAKEILKKRQIRRAFISQFSNLIV